MKFAKVYPPLVQKAERRHRTREAVDEVICWLTGYDTEGLARQLQKDVDDETLFREAPGLHPKAARITGTVCGVRGEAVEDPLMRSVRYLEKLAGEPAKGWTMERILRK